MNPSTSTPPPSSEEGWAGTAGEWLQRGLHRAELWSGMKVVFRFPTLGELITGGHLSDRLLELALLEYGDPGATLKLVADAAAIAVDEQKPQEERDAAARRGEQFGHDIAELNRELAAAALVEPTMTVEQLADPRFPIDDLELLAALINRQAAYDAAGRRIGVEPLDTFRLFRDQHGCAESCPACEQARGELSTVHVGAL